MQPVSFYLHIPFCQHRCGYCDFNTYAGIDHLIPAYIDALQKEILFVAETVPGEKEITVDTIYFGGGTPSLIPGKLLEKILEAIHNSFRIESGCEITLEVNPGTISEQGLDEIFKLGVNRLSIGVQSTDPGELLLLERLHGYQEARQTVDNARKAGFNNISLDLIYGLPHQKVSVWEKTLIEVLNLCPSHMSLYALTVEEGTPLKRKVVAGILPEPDPDIAADLYDLSRSILETKGFTHYEISNWANQTPDNALLYSRHNRTYWLNEPYIGLGAGAHGFIEGIRTINVAHPIKYIKKMSVRTGDNELYPLTPATVDFTPIDKRREMEETIIMGLRLLKEGVSRERFFNRFGQDLEEVFSQQIRKLSELGLLKWGDVDNESLLLSERAYLLANKVFMEFI